MDIVLIFRQLVSFFITYLTTVTVMLLLTGTIRIVNNRNILTDRQHKRKYLERNTMNYNVCRYMYISAMILPLQTLASTANLFLPSLMFVINFYKMNCKIIKIRIFFLQFILLESVKKFSFLVLSFVRFIRLANTFHIISGKNQLTLFASSSNVKMLISKCGGAL